MQKVRYERKNNRWRRASRPPGECLWTRHWFASRNRTRTRVLVQVPHQAARVEARRNEDAEGAGMEEMDTSENEVVGEDDGEEPMDLGGDVDELYMVSVSQDGH